MTAVLKDKENVLSYGIDKEAFGKMVIANKERVSFITKEINKEIYNDLEDGMSL